MSAEPEHERGERPTLSGRRGWIISDGIAGHLAISRGIAERLGLIAEEEQINPRWLWRHLAPRGPADPQVLRSLGLGGRLPDIVLGAGRQTVPVVRALKQRGAFTVLFQSPRASPSSAHLIWAPEHDRLRGGNVITTLTPPHRFSPERLKALRGDLPPALTALPSPRIALLLGGPGAGYHYDDETIEDFRSLLTTCADSAASFMITPSRRTPKPLLRAADEATRSKPRWLWNGQGENPYPQFLAAADTFIVTADSVNMAGEACATGRPVHVFMPKGGRRKFQHYHAALEANGATRRLDTGTGQLAGWTYQPIDAAAHVAQEIEARWRVICKKTLDV